MKRKVIIWVAGLLFGLLFFGLGWTGTRQKTGKKHVNREILGI